MNVSPAVGMRSDSALRSVNSTFWLNAFAFQKNLILTILPPYPRIIRFTKESQGMGMTEEWFTWIKITKHSAPKELLSEFLTIVKKDVN